MPGAEQKQIFSLVEPGITGSSVINTVVLII